MLHFLHQDVFIFRAHPYLLTVLRDTSEGKKKQNKQNRKYKNKQKQILMSKNFS